MALHITYYVSFADGANEFRETEVSRPVYLEFERFVKQERNLRRWDERYLEYSALTDEELLQRAVQKPKDVETLVLENLQNEQLRQTIAELPEVQRRRFILHYIFGMTFRQIGKLEGKHWTSISESICMATKKVKENFER